LCLFFTSNANWCFGYITTKYTILTSAEPHAKVLEEEEEEDNDPREEFAEVGEEKCQWMRLTRSICKC
jgi:hypothetical protein